MAKRKINLCVNFGRCLIFLVLFLFFVVEIVASGSTDLNESQTKNPNPAEGSELSLVFRWFSQIEKRNQEFEKVVEEVKVLKEQLNSLQSSFESSQETCAAQVESLRGKLSGFESKISEDRGVWLLTPPLRGPPGKNGDSGQKGDGGSIGLTGQKGEPGTNGASGQTGRLGEKGDRGNSGGNGAKGDSGQKGEKGSQGPIGSKGDRGEKGEKGEIGQKGERDRSALQPIISCSDAMEILPSSRSETQTIYPHGNRTSLEVVCDFETDGGGWAIIQKRTSGPQYEFHRTWDEYSKGFGSLDGNFWIGLENIHALTKNGDQELRIELEDFEGEKRWAKYSNFSISDVSGFYWLRISGFYQNSTAGDSMNYHNGMGFSTKDKDHDGRSDLNCAAVHRTGGWWHKDCYAVILNGVYFQKGETPPGTLGIYWSEWKGHLAKTEMKIRTRK